MARPAHLSYVLVLLLTAAVSAPVLYFGTWTTRVAGCRSVAQDGAFRAYCASPAYGSYEHEAYAFGLEPQAVQAMRGADILFLGNSKLQFAFSTPQVEAFFRARAASYHLLGFGYGESSGFPRLLLDRYRPAPKVVVINADPFFVPTLSDPAYAIQRSPAAARAGGWMKKAFAAWHGLICRVPSLCSETIPATFRDIRSGQWIWHGVLMPGQAEGRPVTAEKSTGWPAPGLAAWERTAETFLAAMAVRRACVILTGVPNPQVDAEGMAAALGQRLGLTVVSPPLDGLRTADDSHLSADSASRWSAAFLQQAAPVIERCLAG